MLAATPESATSSDVVTSFHVVTLIVGTVFGSGFATFVGMLVRRRDERHSYWKKKRQGLYAKAVGIHKSLSLANMNMSAVTAPLEGIPPMPLGAQWEVTLEDTYHKVDILYGELVSVMSSIDLLATERTKSIVFRYWMELYRYRLLLTHIEDETLPSEISSAYIEEKMTDLPNNVNRLGNKMEKAFRKELGVDRPRVNRWRSRSNAPGIDEELRRLRGS